MKLKIFLFLSLLYECAYAQIDNHQLHLLEHGQEIPAYLAHTDLTFVSSTLRNEFCTKELMNKQLSIGLNYEENLFLCKISHIGWNNFGKMDLRIGYARRFGKKISIALHTVYLMEHAINYKLRHSFTLDLSGAWKITPKIILAVDFFNPIHLHYELNGNEIIPLTIRMETYYHPSKKISGSLFFQKTIPGGLDIALSCEYQPTTALLLHGECSLKYCSLGIIIPLKRVTLIIESDWYYRIALSTEGSIYYLF